MADDIAIKVDNVSKSFVLPHEKHTSIKGALINFGRSKKGYEKQEVLKDISFEIKKGEFFGIVGRNGSGKSTLLKLLAGIYTPDKGGIQINGKLTPFIELGVGFNPELSGRENVFLNGALLGFNRTEMEAMYEDIVKFAELERFMDQKLKNYSSGMQVRLAFSIAIRANSDILLLDEVLAVGDAAFQKKCYDYFKLLKRNHKTVVLVTHDMNAVRQYCDKTIMVDEGLIKKKGRPEETAQAYQKLFSEADTDETSHDSKRWGTGKLHVNKPKITINISSIEITSHFVARANIDAPILGFSIFGPTGINVMESNTLRTNNKTKPLNTGEAIEIIWQIPNIFTNGKHTISIAACNQDLTEYYDWVNEALSFQVNKPENTTGIVDPQVKIVKLKL